MSASPLPWRYDPERQSVLDLDGLEVADVTGGRPDTSGDDEWAKAIDSTGALIVAAVNALAENDAAILAWWDEHEHDSTADCDASGEAHFYPIYEAPPSFVTSALARRSTP